MSHFHTLSPPDVEEPTRLIATGPIMTLAALPDLAIFRFLNPCAGHSSKQAFQKQARSGTIRGKKISYVYCPLAVQVGRAWRRSSIGMGGAHTGRKVVLVQLRRKELKQLKQL